MGAVCWRWAMALGVTVLPVSPIPAVGQAIPAGRARSFTAADVAFMQGMIAHHEQAIAMAALVRARTKTAALGLLARRIDVSQRDEIKLMTRWLDDHRQPNRLPMVPDQM